MKTIRIVLTVLALTVSGLSQSAHAQDDDDEKMSFSEWLKATIHHKKMPSTFTLMAATTKSYDEDFAGIGGSGFTITAQKHLFKENAYTSITLFGPHRYHYVKDTIDVVVEMLSADVGLGVAIPNMTSGLLGGTSFGVFGGLGVRNNSEELPIRYGMCLNVHLNFFTFTDGWGNEDMFGMFMRSTYSAVTFTYADEKKQGMNEEIEWGLKLSILKYGR
jgi:hypothetical protein